MTPQVIQKVEDITQLSSPIDQYTFTCTQSPMTAWFQHKVSDRLKLKVCPTRYLLTHLQEAKGTIMSLEDRVRAIEEERKEQDNLILKWETCDI